jgi:hypothetical protein
MITPNTNIKLLKVPFSSSQNHVLKFASETEQLTYMNSKVVYSRVNCTYQREESGEFLKIEMNVDSLYDCNYVMFQNANYSNKWFYAFIDKIIYLNTKVTKVYLTLDVYQTFMFNFTMPNVFIDRQTFDTDSYNTLPDTPSTGDLTNVFEFSQPLVGGYFVLFNSDPTKDDTTSSTLQYPVIGNYSIPCYMFFSTSHLLMSELVQEVSNKGRADRIQACYFAPSSPLGGINDLNFSYFGVDKGDLNLPNNPILLFVSEIVQTKLYNDITVNINYTPEYKKELTYPYAKLEIVDKITGKFIELDISKFQNPLSPQFRIMNTVTDSPEYKVIPLNYNGIPYSIENSLIIEPSTQMPVFSNTYAKYLKDNAMSNVLSMALSASSAVGSIASGNIAGSVGSFANIAETLNKNQVMKSQANQCSGIKGDASDYVNFSPSILFRLKVMDSDHMEIARNFWKCFGYPVRKISTFNNTSNKYNFIKTVDCSLIADSIPSEYQAQLESLFNKGVTIWNSDYLNY